MRNASINEATDPDESAYQLPKCGDKVENGDLSGVQDLETIMETECTAEAYPGTTGDCGNGVESDEEIQQPTLTTSLMNCAMEYGITLDALTALLSV